MRRQSRTYIQQEQDKGFTILELMIVVSLIAIVVALAFPSISAARKLAHETAAISYLKAVHAGQTLYRNRFGVYAHSDELLVAEGFIKGTPGDTPSGGGSNTFSGFYMIVDPVGRSWEATAGPTDPGETGDRSFYINESGVIRWSDTGQADEDSPPLDAMP